MYLRGFSVEKVDLYKSNADKFILHEKSLLPPFTALTGISTMAANNIVQARLEGNSLLLMTSKSVLVYLHQLLNACVNMVA